jgi:hypothetical protein
MNGASYKSVDSQAVPIAKIPSNFTVTYYEAFPIQADLSAKAKTQKGRHIGCGVLLSQEFSGDHGTCGPSTFFKSLIFRCIKCRVGGLPASEVDGRS